ncbi:MAG: Gfo/Idh/MocA family protein [Kiritimatiellia bacterium]|jgi:scyllo-inositol 2-dehydrogenase (NADP+)
MKTASRQYNLAIVGLGGMGNWHRETIERIDNLQVCGSFDIKASRQQFAKDHGIAPYESFEAVLADPKVDIVLCATPNDSHLDIVVRSLEAGKHVVCEKPVALSSIELQKMIDASKKANRLFVVHQNRRWDEDYLTMKKIFDEGLLGEVFRIESRVHGSRGIPGDWRQEKERGGGMVLDWGVHTIDQMLLLVPGKVKKVYASVTHITNELVDDGFYAELTFESGVHALLEVGTSNFVSLPRWYMLGRDGTAVIRDWSLSGEMVRITDWSKNDAVPIRTAAGLTKTMAPRTNDTIHTQPLPVVKSDIRDFYRNVLGTIEGKAEIIVKHDQVMRVMKLMEAIFASSERQQAVDFE